MILDLQSSISHHRINHKRKNACNYALKKTSDAFSSVAEANSKLLGGDCKLLRSIDGLFIEEVECKLLESAMEFFIEEYEE